MHKNQTLEFMTSNKLVWIIDRLAPAILLIANPAVDSSRKLVFSLVKK